MINHPECQRRAQAEIEAVLGKHQLPSFEDEEALPYVTAIVKETLRWQPVTPLAVPHLLTEDDEYNGYFIPKGAYIIPNVWYEPLFSLFSRSHQS